MAKDRCKPFQEVSEYSYRPPYNTHNYQSVIFTHDQDKDIAFMIILLQESRHYNVRATKKVISLTESDIICNERFDSSTLVTGVINARLQKLGNTDPKRYRYFA